MPTNQLHKLTNPAGMSSKIFYTTRKRHGDDDRLLLSLRRCFGPRSIRVLRFTMFRHGFWLVRYEVAPLVGAEHTGTIMHADVRAHGVRVAHKVPTMRTEDLLNRRTVRENLRTTQRQNRMERHQSQHLRTEALVVGGEQIVIFIKETRQNVVKLKVLHIAIRRRLKHLVATDIGQRLLEIFVKELRILVAIQDAFHAFEAFLDVWVAVQYGQYVIYHQVHVAVIPGVLR